MCGAAMKACHAVSMHGDVCQTRVDVLTRHASPKTAGPPGRPGAAVSSCQTIINSFETLEKREISRRREEKAAAEETDLRFKRDMYSIPEQRLEIACLITPPRFLDGRFKD